MWCAITASAGATGELDDELELPQHTSELDFHPLISLRIAGLVDREPPRSTPLEAGAQLDVVAGVEDAGAMAGAGEGGVAGLPVEVLVGVHERAVAGHSLGLVNRRRVAVGEVRIQEVVARDKPVAAAVERDGQLAALDVDGGDPAGVTVEEPEVVAIPQGGDPIADGEGERPSTQSSGPASSPRSTR